MHDTTNFIRMMSPDAGGTDQVSKNRGYVAVKEVGDQVMVGFVHNRPDRPFVMRGMFHGQVALGGGVNNHMRSIQTKSGIKVLMNDDEKSVTILDPCGNTYFMDGNVNIEVTAPKNMTFNAGENMDINVGQNMTTSVGKDQSLSIANNISTSAGNKIAISAGNDIMESVTGNRMEVSNNRKEMVDQTILRNSQSSETFAGEINFNTIKENMTMQSAKTIEWNSGEKSNLF